MKFFVLSFFAFFVVNAREEKDMLRNPLWHDYKDDNGKYVIPYVINGSYGKEKKVLFEMMDEIDKNTCVRFSPRTTEQDYIEIVNKVGEGCATVVGKPGGKSTVWLESSRIQNCLTPQSTMKKLMHVIGLPHEHSRPERKDHIKIHWENIEEGVLNQFGLTSFEPDPHGIPYDYYSIMHYPKDAFAKKPGMITIETLDKKYQDIIGNQEKPSKLDYKKICFMYKCEVCMGEKMEY
ncbi:astacin [Ancylostoma duodenale]|uniref:Metalloendopeptidase n=1 Tax=Ancylostoma duodenale TaxID=51022 RepID=A0A0C2GAR2_9BILA|nr:astacin [Ancylostoma duodenale]